MSLPLPQALLEPLFLLGATRSGTTLLSLMLGHHPRIGDCGEFEWPFDFEIEQPGGSLQDYYRWLHVNRLFRWHEQTIDESLSREDLIRSFLLGQYVQRGAGKPVVCVQVHRHYERLLELWPNARFLHIVRDGRDVCASWMRHGWTGNGYGSARDWQASLASWAVLRERIDPSRRYEVRFEDLLLEPEKHLGAMCALLGDHFDEAMLRFHEDTTYDPINRAQASKWRKELPELQIRLFEAVAGDALQERGYALSGLPRLSLNPWLMPAVVLDDRVRKQLARMHRFGAPLWLADQLTRRLPLGPLYERVQLRMHDITNASLQ